MPILAKFIIWKIWALSPNFDQDEEVVGIEVLSAREHIFKKEGDLKVMLENLKAA